MTLEQPGLDSDPPNGLGRERGATMITKNQILESKVSKPISLFSMD